MPALLSPSRRLVTREPDFGALSRTTNGRGASAALRTTLGYGVAAVLAIAMVTLLLRLWQADLAVPLFDGGGDDSHYQAMIKTIAETGWYYHNDRIGQLGGRDMREFPCADGWFHLAIIRLLCLFDDNPFRLTNFFYLLTFPLTALTSLFVCRRLGISYLTSLVVSLLYTFAWYHFFRSMHLFLVAYYLIPLAVLLAVRVYQGRLPFRRDIERNGNQWSFCDTAAAKVILVAVLVGMGGVYYAFFACFFLMIAGIARAGTERRWLPLVSAAMVCSIVSAALVVSLAPSIHYKLVRSRNSEASKRSAFESESLGLKPVQLLWPITGHRLELLRRFKEKYNSSGVPLINENDGASLGLIGAAGLLFLLGRLFLRPNRTPGDLLDCLALLTLAAILLGTVGGLGSAIAFLASPWIRGYNRISIYIAFFALLAIGVLLDRWRKQWSETPRRCFAFAATLAALLVVGIADQTSGEVSDYRGLSERSADLRQLVEHIETDATPGGIVFQLPHAPYPESVFETGVPSYRHLAPYLHSRRVRWSYGGMSGHYGDEWARGLSRLPVTTMLDQLARAECLGICVDRVGYNDYGRAVEKELQMQLGAKPLVTADGERSYFDLRAFTENLRRHSSPERWQVLHESATHPVVPLWRNGFRAEFRMEEGYTRWCPRGGDLHLANSLDRPRQVRLRFLVKFNKHTPSTMCLRGMGLDESIPVDSMQQSYLLDRRVTVPPGESVVRLECHDVAGDNRKIRQLDFSVVDPHCEEELPDAF